MGIDFFVSEITSIFPYRKINFRYKNIFRYRKFEAPLSKNDFSISEI